MAEGYIMSFNQNFTSISVASKNGFRLYSIEAIDNIKEIFAKECAEHIRIIEKLYNTSLILLVTQQKPSCLRVLNFKKKHVIGNYNFPSAILCVRMNRERLVVCLAEGIHIYDLHKMKPLYSIESIAPNEYIFCSLSSKSHLAFPTFTRSGELKIFNAKKFKMGLTIKAHHTALSAMNFSPNSLLLATASERGTVIRVFCVKNGQRLQEFRRGVKRCVQIASLEFSTTGNFLCASSNTETVHIFKIDGKAVEEAELESTIGSNDAHKNRNSTSTPSISSENDTCSSNSNGHQTISSSNVATPTTTTSTECVNTNTSNNSIPAPPTSTSWSMTGYLSKTVSSYLIPSQIGDVLAQDRAFATAVLGQPGLKHTCALLCIKNELHLFVACEDGFLYIYDFNSEQGGPCKLLHVHDLRSTLEGVIELSLADSIEQMSVSDGLSSTLTTNPSAGYLVDKTAHGATQFKHSKDLISPASASPNSKSSSTSSVSCIILNPESCSDRTYAGILKGSERSLNTTMTDSTTFRRICDAIDTPAKLYDEHQFPPVAISARD